MKPIKAKRNVIYRVIFGHGNWKLHKVPPTITEDCDFYCFVDKASSARIRKTKPWNIVEIDEYPAGIEDQRKASRYFKILGLNIFPHADTVLYMDAGFELLVPLSQIINKTLTPNIHFATFRHQHRSCLYEELEACITRGKDDPAIMKSQVARYREEGMPENFGLCECGVLLRRNVPSTRRFCDLWWREIFTGSYRDQLSIMYVLWKTGFPILAFPGFSQEDGSCPYFSFTKAFHPK